MCGKAFWKMGIFLFAFFAFSESLTKTTCAFKRQTAEEAKMVRPLLVPERILKQQADLRYTKTQLTKSGKGYCVIQNDDGTTEWYYAGFDSSMGFAVYMDPSKCSAPFTYPFKITQVHFYLYHTSIGWSWPVNIQVNVREVTLGDKCLGPEILNVLFSESFTIPIDSSYDSLVGRPMNLSLSTSCYVSQPFFLEIKYLDHFAEGDALPSLLMDLSVAPEDSCDNWGTYDGQYYKWSDFWGPYPPGDAIIRAGGYTSEECIYPEHFVFRDSTGEGYSMVIDSAFLDGLELEECDEIGVFDDTGGGKGLLCVGASVYHLDSLPIPLIAWKDDPLTDVKDGYTPGDTMCFRVWSRSQDREECALSHYSIGDGRFGTGTHSQLWLEAPCKCLDLPLQSGWQWISTNIDPDPCEMESLFVNCWDVLDIIIACDGSFCIPGVGCWIDCWNVLEMYKVHMADTCTIPVCGSKVPTDTPIPFHEKGWYCIAYFPECPLEPETALVSIWNNLDIVKNDAGEFCIPGVGCWIDCMEYNEGYKVHLSSADTLIYPTSCPPCPPPFAKRNSFPGFTQTTHFNYSENTGETYSIVVNSVELSGKLPEVGNEIGVFTSSGLCVGAGVWQGEILGIAAWQDDDRTKVLDGFQVGEQMVFKLWDISDNKEIELSAIFERGDGRFGTDAYALVNLKGISSQLPKQFELAQNYPNPFNPETIIQFSIPQPTHVKVEIVNILGQKVATLVDSHKESGNYQVRWDGTDSQGITVANGIYFYRLVTDEHSIVRKMLLIK